MSFLKGKSLNALIFSGITIRLNNYFNYLALVSICFNCEFMCTNR